MITLMAAAVLAAQAPAGPASADPQLRHEHHMQTGQAGEHKGMDCCKDCCNDMAKKHEADRAGHESHPAH